jgi:general secretion pathway protein A
VQGDRSLIEAARDTPKISRSFSMYLSHFKLHQRPFDISPDPDFLWLGEKHREGLAILKYGILENKGFLMITGDVGTGKTALIRAIEREVQAHLIVVTIPDPSLTLMDFYNVMAFELGMERSFANKGEFLIAFKRLIVQAANSQRRVLMIVDEAHRLSSELLEEIRLLSNIDLCGQIRLNTFFVGQLEFKALISRPENRAVRQRITVSYELEPLTVQETQTYISHRLRVAGATRAIFSTESVQPVHALSNGYPRLINIICDHALLSAYASGADNIGAEIIADCGKELRTTTGTTALERTIAPTPIVQPPAPDQSPSAPPTAPHLPPPTLHPRRTGGERWLWAGVSCVLLALLIWSSLHNVTGPVADRIPKKELLASAPSEEKGTQQLIVGQPPPSLPLKKEPQVTAPVLKRMPPVAPAAIQADPADSLVAPEPIDNRRANPAPPSLPPSLPPESMPATPAPQKLQQPVQPAPSPKSAPTPPQEFTILFEGNSMTLPVNADERLIAVAGALGNAPRAFAAVEGHTNSTEDASTNRVISYARAAAVRDSLNARGIDLGRIRIAVFGAEKPVDSNLTMEGLSRNSRVVIRVITEPLP